MAADDAARLAGQAETFRNRLEKNRRRLGRWAERAGVTCWRVYDRDVPEIPLVVDWYEGRLHVAEFETPKRPEGDAGDRQRDLLVEAARDVLGVAPGDVFVKSRRRQTGGAQYGRQGDRGAVFVVGEGGHRFEVNLSDFLDTGLFLDHRPTRALFAAECAGRRVLNLFAYTGSFTVYAAGAGAERTTSIDLSGRYLDWAGRNLALNGHDRSRNDLLRADVVAWLRSPDRRRERYDLVLLDPPTWSTSERMEGDLDVQRDHVALVQASLALLPPGGVLWFSTNHRRFVLDPVAFDGSRWEEVTRRTLPPDFRDPRVHRVFRAVRA